MFSLQPQGWTTWKKEYSSLEGKKKKKVDANSAVWIFTSVRELDKERFRKKNSRGCILPQPGHSGSNAHYLAVQWVEMEQKKMQITGSYTKCVLHQPLFNMCSAFCLHSYAFSRLVPKDHSSKHTVLVGSRNKYRMHSNFLSSRSIPNWPCWLRELYAWMC